MSWLFLALFTALILYVFMPILIVAWMAARWNRDRWQAVRRGVGLMLAWILIIAIFAAYLLDSSWFSENVIDVNNSMSTLLALGAATAVFWTYIHLIYGIFKRD
jgi:cytochrome c biogenesis protein CcdA